MFFKGSDRFRETLSRKEGTVQNVTFVPDLDDADSEVRIEPEDIEDEFYQIEEYDLVSSPNDFNLLTIYNFIDSGAIEIPAFQRHFVWDIKRSSKLIESLILGLPVPQVFLYEQERNRLIVIDGQQRLMSIYYFVKQRFPRREKRPEIRRIFDEFGNIPDQYLYDDNLFQKFDLRLPAHPSRRKNRLDGLNYSTLGEAKRSFDLRTIRNVIVKQVRPQNDTSSIHEMFNRLNSGGMNITPQEIRLSLFHSNFMAMLLKLNLDTRWRRLIGKRDPDPRMRDVEVLLRAFAMLISGSQYGSSMILFLDNFAKRASSFSDTDVQDLRNLFSSFLESTSALPSEAFFGQTNQFNTSLFEAVFTAVCEAPYGSRSLQVSPLDFEAIQRLKNDAEFLDASQKRTTHGSNVRLRLARAAVLLG